MKQDRRVWRKFHIEQGIQIVVEMLLFCFLAFVFVKGFGQWEAIGSFDMLAQTGSFLFLLCFFYGAFLFFQAMPKAWQRKWFLLQWIFVIAVQLYFLLYYRSTYLWDGAFVVGGANSLLEEGRVAGEAWYYLSVYPNQNGFVLLTMVLLKLGKWLGLTGGGLTLLLNGVNLIALDVSLLFTFLIWNKGKQQEDEAFHNFLLFYLGCNPFLYVTVSYYYTMTLSLPWFMGFLYFVVSMIAGNEKKEPFKKQMLRAVLAGVCFSGGYYLRATTVIPMIAAVICLFLFMWKNHKMLSFQSGIKELSFIGVLTLTAFVLTACLTATGARVVGIDTEHTAFPATHWLMMSLSGEGFHNGEDEAYTAGFSTKEEKKQAVMERLKERVKELGATGLLKQAGKKIKHTFSGGANSYKMFYENALRMDKGYSYILGEKSEGFLCYAQAYHLLTLFLIVFSFTKKFQWKSFLLQLTLLGGFLFYVLWEAAAQYQIPFLLVMGLLAVMGAEKRTKILPEPFKKYIFPLAGLAGTFLISLFLLINLGCYTKEERDTSHPVVTQLLADEPLAVKEQLTQSFLPDQPFNYLLFQWRNPLGEENDSAYEISLEGSKSGLIFIENLKSPGQAYQGGFEKQFETVYPKEGETFFLHIKKTDGGKESYLEFVTYYMGGYDSYPRGSCQESGRDLTFLVAKKDGKALYSIKEYGIFITGFFLLFLFCGFCCKISNSGKRKDIANGS